MKYLIFPVLYFFLYLIKFIRKGLSSNTNMDGILLVKYGRLGDIYILMNALRNVNLGDVKVALPKTYHVLFNKHFPELRLLPLYGVRDWHSQEFCSWLTMLCKRKFSKVLILGGSRSPLEEDFIAALQIGKQNTAVCTDTTKIPRIFGPISDSFYDSIFKKQSELEFDIIHGHLKQEGMVHAPDPNKFDRPGTDKYVLVCPGASDYRRSWSLTYLNELLKNLLSESETTICVVGSEADGELFRGIENIYHQNKKIKFQFKNLILTQLDELVSRAFKVITNDSATLHMAVFHDVEYEVHSGFGHYERFCNYKKITPEDILSCANCNWSCRYTMRTGEKFPCVRQLKVK